jgi:hypothetical protein
MTLATPLTTAGTEMLPEDTYKDVHKGIRTALFDVTACAGRVDPGDRGAIAEVTGRVRDLVQMLVAHAEHEDRFLQPLIEQHLPELGEQIARAHTTIEAQLAELEVFADQAEAADPAASRALVHRLYVALASFTAVFLEHMGVEETEVMPGLAAAVPTEQLIAVHQELVASIPPEQMAAWLPLMVAAMNLEDRVEMFTGMQMGAPPEVFAGVCAMAQAVLPAPDYAALAERVGIGA